MKVEALAIQLVSRFATAMGHAGAPPSTLIDFVLYLLASNPATKHADERVFIDNLAKSGTLFFVM
jgi:hypothetical protein